MKITKFGHCCLLIEEKEVRIITDPGSYSILQDLVKRINIVLITHEHQDHFHIGSVLTILKNNPKVKIITNKSVGALLAKEKIPFSIVEHGQSYSEKDIMIEVVGKKHALMHSTIQPIQNTGYFIANRFFYPGDSFTNPRRRVKIFALPVAGPWMKLPEAIDYALKLKPKVCFPVHEGILQKPGSVHSIPPKVLEKHGIKFSVLEIDKKYEF